MFKKVLMYILFFLSVYNFVVFFDWYLGDNQMIIEDALTLSINSSMTLFIFIFAIHLIYHKNDKDAAQVISYPPIIFLFSFNCGFTMATLNIYHFQYYKVSMIFDFLRNQEIGFSLIIIAFLIVASALRVFGKNDEDPKPTSPSNLIITDGIYRYTRNPMYLGLLILQVGLGMILSMTHIVFFTFLTYVLFRYGVIKKEEYYLEKKFGSTYLDYKNKTRRWF
tara:strand:+ start:1684 stop:2349 length:666 start_codon:yes stop_codon:yes gene_type:complete